MFRTGVAWTSSIGRGVLRSSVEAAGITEDDCASRYDVIVAEGAGSPTEINLRDGDYVNMGLARHAGLPTVVVGDIDRGGALAAVFGTVALLDAAHPALMTGLIAHMSRGRPALPQPP